MSPQPRGRVFPGSAPTPAPAPLVSVNCQEARQLDHALRSLGLLSYLAEVTWFIIFISKTLNEPPPTHAFI